MTGIYMVQNMVNGKIYVGQAVDIEKRWGEHKAGLNGGKHVNKHLQAAWNKYGANNFEFTVLTECPEEQLNTMEQYYIFCLETTDPIVGYNKTYGGGSGRPCEETKRKMSESLKGENNPLYGKTHSAETKRRMSEAKKGMFINRKDQSKSVIGIHKVTGLIVEYPSTREAMRQTGIPSSSIVNCCKKRRYKSAGGYIWIYSDEQ